MGFGCVLFCLRISFSTVRSSISGLRNFPPSWVFICIEFRWVVHWSGSKFVGNSDVLLCVFLGPREGGAEGPSLSDWFLLYRIILFLVLSPLGPLVLVGV